MLKARWSFLMDRTGKYFWSAREGRSPRPTGIGTPARSVAGGGWG